VVKAGLQTNLLPGESLLVGYHCPFRGRPRVPSGEIFRATHAMSKQSPTLIR
jgi:hypothetical protein